MTRTVLLSGVVALVVMAAGLNGGAARAADALEVKGTITDVTVYRGQALVTRQIDVAGPAGVKEITVTNLPDQIEPGSIYAEGGDGVEVQSVSYGVQPVANDVRDEVKQFDDKIRDATDKLNALQRKRQLLETEKDYLSKLETFAATTSTTELSKGVLNADTLDKLTQNQFKRRSDIMDEELKLDVDMRTLNDDLQTLQRSRGQVATSSSKLAREAKVFVALTAPGAKIRLRYVVDNATWMPSYNVRADAAKEKVTVEYMASIQQISGEDWNNVKMTLSTATPSLLAKAPVLNELAISLSRPGTAGVVDVLSQIEQSGGSDQARLDLLQQRQTLESYRGTIGASNSITNSGFGAATQPAVANNYININGVMVNVDYIGDNNDLDLILNKTAGDLQLVDLLARERIARAKDGKPISLRADEGLAITYVVKNPTSLASRSDRQLIQITTIPLKATFYKVATPVLASYVYDEATAVNDSDTVLLAGDVATYVNNEFVGRGVMPSVSTGQSFNVGLGIDSSLRAHRTLVEKTESPMGGNRKVDFTYKMSVENFGTKLATVRLQDRLPTAKETEIQVNRTKIEKLSADPDYLEGDAKKGILRWDLQVPPGAVDAKAVTFEYQFNLQYDRQMTIASPQPVLAPQGNPGGQGAGGGGGGGGGRGGFGGNNGGGFGGGGGAGGGAGRGR